jgi:O-antigen ligase
MLQEPAELMAGLQAYVLGAFVPIVSSINNYIHGTMAENYEVRFSATGVNAVDLALFLLLGLPIAWHLFKHLDKKKYRILRILNIVYMPLSVFAILLTASRTSLFAIVPAVIFIAWPKRIDIGRLIWTFIFLVGSILIFWAILPSSIIDRLASVSTSISSADIGGRVNLWRETIASFIQYPVFGSGSGTMPSIIGGLSHETFLSVLAETGLIGFALFLCILVFVINEAVWISKRFSGVWLSSLFVWLIGVLSLSFEFRKVTWLVFSFVIIDAYSLHKKSQPAQVELDLSETEGRRTLSKAMGPKV